MADQLPLFAADDAATAAIGHQLAGLLCSGDLVLLQGDLGAGKTALARALVRGLADDPALEVPSPTFLLVLPYDTPSGPVLHADLYRLADASELDELGLFDDAEAIVLVEWPDRVPDLAARADLIVAIDMAPAGTGRNFVLSTPKDGARLNGIQTALAGFAT